MTRQSRLAALFRPRGVAVVGASADPTKLGSAMLRALAGFPGHVAAVNPRVDGMHASLGAAAAAGPVDLAMLCVPAKACPQVFAEAAAAGVRAVVICGGGFAEAGEEGAALQAQLAGLAVDTGTRLLGPNTSGFLVPATGLTASFVPAAADVPAGRVAVVAASGGVNHAVSFLLAEAGHGVSLAVGLGNSADVDAADVLEYLADDPTTAAVALHLESVSDGPRLLDAVRRLTVTTPVVALVVGRHDVAAFAASHTGALATSWRTTRSALAAAGAVLVDDERQLVDAVGALSGVRLAANPMPGVAVVTAQAGPGLLLLDGLRGRRITIPELTESTREVLGALLPALTFQRNPVDTGRPGPGFGAVLAAVGADPGVDLIAGYALDEPDAFDLRAAVARRDPTVPLVFGVGGPGPVVRETRRALHEAGVAVTDGPAGVAIATAALVADARARHRAAAPTEPVTPPLPTVPRGPIDEHRAKEFLATLGIAGPRRRVCDSRVAAEQALADLGGPVAVKILDAAVLHKTDVGGVHLGVSTPAELAAALDALEGIGARRVLVEAMAAPGLDLIVGAHRDPVFGPMVMLGLGGTAAEALGDVVVHPAPLSATRAAALPEELAAAVLLGGWRGGPPLDTDALGRILAVLGDLLAQPHLLEIEINPLRLHPDGLLALDAVIRTREVPDGHADR
jgi:acetyltransferase